MSALTSPSQHSSCPCESCVWLAQCLSRQEGQRQCQPRKEAELKMALIRWDGQPLRQTCVAPQWDSV